MAALGEIVIYVMMVFVLIGAVAAVRDSQSGFGKEFLQGIHAIGYLFIPVAGVMAALPFLSKFVESVLGPVWKAMGSDPSMAATTFIATDMGGYHLAQETASSTGDWITAMMTGYMAGATIVFSIPVGLAILAKRDHKYMALGVMSGILTIPVGVVLAMLTVMWSGARIRSEASPTGPADTPVEGLTIGALVGNMIPLIIVIAVIAAGLKFLPDLMIKLFMWFGRFVDAAAKLLLAISIVEYFTGIFSRIFGAWGFGAIIATPDDQFRALEVAGAVGIMLAGAFPMVYAIQKYLSQPLAWLGSRFGLSETAMAGILGSTANILALFHLIEKMSAKDKVMTIAFATTGAFLLGDHLSFTANFQPNLIAAVLLGKIVAAVCAMVIARFIAVPTAIRHEEAQAKADGLSETGARHHHDEEQESAPRWLERDDVIEEPR